MSLLWVLDQASGECVGNAGGDSRWAADRDARQADQQQAELGQVQPLAVTAGARHLLRQRGPSQWGGGPSGAVYTAQTRMKQ